MTIKEIIEDLKAQIQQLEDAKQQLTETQEDLRETICFFQLALEAKTDVVQPAEL